MTKCGKSPVNSRRTACSNAYVEVMVQLVQLLSFCIIWFTSGMNFVIGIIKVARETCERKAVRAFYLRHLDLRSL